MKIIVGDTFVSEIVEDGLELGHEFECGHSTYTKKVWDNVVKFYTTDGVERVQNIYYDGEKYVVVLVMRDGKKEVKELDIPK